MSEVQLVVFRLGQEEYGVNIMQVQEIGPFVNPIPVPNAPEFVEGIMNLRGEIIPVVSLKKRFNLPVGEVTENTRTIVVNTDARQVGFTVDDASEVLTLNEENIEPAPEMIRGSDRKYISGIGKQGSRILVVLDLNALFTEQEKEEIEKME